MDQHTTTIEERSGDYRTVEEAIRFLEANALRQPRLSEVAAAVGLSEFHFQRLFSRWAGISPKRFLQFLTKESARNMLDASESLLQTSTAVGLSSLGRLHDLFVATEALTPGEYGSRGAGVTIRYGVHRSPFGTCLIGVSDRGVCHLSFITSSESAAVDGLASEWEQAVVVEDARRTRPFVEPIFALGGSEDTPLAVHLRGTNFQLKVWEALLRIPPGSATSYGRLAGLIGQPRAARAVGTAVAHNRVAILIPCHRVIRETGEFGNYRYGSARKQALLAWEASRMNPAWMAADSLERARA